MRACARTVSGSTGLWMTVAFNLAMVVAWVSVSVWVCVRRWLSLGPGLGVRDRNIEFYIPLATLACAYDIGHPWGAQTPVEHEIAAFKERVFFRNGLAVSGERQCV